MALGFKNYQSNLGNDDHQPVDADNQNEAEETKTYLDDLLDQEVAEQPYEMKNDQEVEPEDHLAKRGPVAIVKQEPEPAPKEEASTSENTVMSKPKRKRRKKQLRDASPGQEFYIHEGPMIKNVSELRDAMIELSQDQYEYHIKRGENDFANWLRGVLNERGLATRVEMIKTKNGTARLLGRFLKARHEGKNKY